jgi:hypothetical protein
VPTCITADRDELAGCPPVGDEKAAEGEDADLRGTVHSTISRSRNRVESVVDLSGATRTTGGRRRERASRSLRRILS